MEEPGAFSAQQHSTHLHGRFGEGALSEKDWQLALRMHDETLVRLKRISHLFAKAVGSNQ